MVYASQLEKIESFVLGKKGFVKLPKEEFGHFSSHSCYLFLCTQVGDLIFHCSLAHVGQWRTLEPSTSSNDEELDEELECIAYFWQGRNAPKMSRLFFEFEFEILPFSCYPD